MQDRYAKPTFSIDRFDKDGDAYEKGVYLHFGFVSVKVADTKEEYRDFVAYLERIGSEIVDGVVLDE